VSSRWPAQGVLATCTGKAGRGSLGGVLAGLGHGDGALWVGVGETMPVGNEQRAEGEERGSGRLLPSPSVSHGLGQGRGSWGSTAGYSTSMATGPRRTGTALVTVTSISWIFAHQVLDTMPARIQNLNF
jgi:hypothetical protein